MVSTSVTQEIHRQVEKYHTRETKAISRFSTDLPITGERIIKRSERVFEGIDDRLLLLLCKNIMDLDSLHDNVTSIFPNIRFNNTDKSKLDAQEVKRVFMGCLETCSLDINTEILSELLYQAWEKRQFNEVNITRALRSSSASVHVPS